MAMTDIDIIFKIIEANIIRSNRFTFKLNMPSIPEVQKYGSKTNSDILTAYIKDAKLPGISLTIKESVYMGLIRQSIIKQTIEGITVTFYDTKEQVIRQMFMDWFNAIVPKEKMTLLKYYPNQYTTTANFTIENSSYILKGVIPSSIGDFNASNDSKNQLGTFDVIFKVKSIN